MDEFNNCEIEIDDLLAVPKKRMKSGDKGKRIERELASILENRFNKPFSRSVGSGNRWGQVSNMPQHAKDTFSGDIVCPEGFRFVIECKGGYEDIDLVTLFAGKNALLDSFLEQSAKEADRSGRQPLLLWRKNRKPWLAFLPENAAPTQSPNSVARMYYKKWIVLPMVDLLSIDDSFFFVED